MEAGEWAKLCAARALARERLHCIEQFGIGCGKGGEDTNGFQFQVKNAHYATQSGHREGVSLGCTLTHNETAITQAGVTHAALADCVDLIANQLQTVDFSEGGCSILQPTKCSPTSCRDTKSQPRVLCAAASTMPNTAHLSVLQMSPSNASVANGIQPVTLVMHSGSSVEAVACGVVVFATWLTQKAKLFVASSVP